MRPKQNQQRLDESLLRKQHPGQRQRGEQQEFILEHVLATEFWGLELVHQVHHEAVPQIFEDMEMEVVSVGVHQSGQGADTGQNGIPLQRNAAFCSAAEQPFQSVARGG